MTNMLRTMGFNKSDITDDKPILYACQTILSNMLIKVVFFCAYITDLKLLSILAQKCRIYPIGLITCFSMASTD